MKVLKTGSENNELWSAEYSCTGKGWNQGSVIPCGALLEVGATDIIKRSYTSYGDTWATPYYGFTCPVCGCYTEVNGLPEYVKRMARPYHSQSEGDK